MRQCLLVFDNVKSTTVRSGSSSHTSEAAHLTSFLPHSKLCSVILPTTESDTAGALAPLNAIALHELTPDAALRMLENRLTRSLLHVERLRAMDLLRRLSYLPLAIVQAAAHMEATRATVQQYHTQLAEHQDAALEYINDSPRGELRASCIGDTVAATLSLSISQVRHRSAVAADYLFLAACVD